MIGGDSMKKEKIKVYTYTRESTPMQLMDTH